MAKGRGCTVTTSHDPQRTVTIFADVLCCVYLRIIAETPLRLASYVICGSVQFNNFMV